MAPARRHARQRPRHRAQRRDGRAYRWLRRIEMRAAATRRDIAPITGGAKVAPALLLFFRRRSSRRRRALARRGVARPRPMARPAAGDRPDHARPRPAAPRATVDPEVAHALPLRRQRLRAVRNRRGGMAERKRSNPAASRRAQMPRHLVAPASRRSAGSGNLPPEPCRRRRSDRDRRLPLGGRPARDHILGRGRAARAPDRPEHRLDRRPAPVRSRRPAAARVEKKPVPRRAFSVAARGSPRRLADRAPVLRSRPCSFLGYRGSAPAAARRGRPPRGGAGGARRPVRSPTCRRIRSATESTSSDGRSTRSSASQTDRRPVYGAGAANYRSRAARSWRMRPPALRGRRSRHGGPDRDEPPDPRRKLGRRGRPACGRSHEPMKGRPAAQQPLSIEIEQGCPSQGRARRGPAHVSRAAGRDDRPGRRAKSSPQASRWPDRGHKMLCLAIDRPTRPSAAGLDERALLDPGYSPEGDWPGAPAWASASRFGWSQPRRGGRRRAADRRLALLPLSAAARAGRALVRSERLTPASPRLRRAGPPCQSAARSAIAGGLAGACSSMVEPAAHNGLVGGSSPSGPTRLRPLWAVGWQATGARRG